MKGRAAPSPLAGKLFDETGARLTPSHTKKKNGPTAPLLRLPAPVVSENTNGAESSNPRGIFEIRGDQPTRHWLCDRRSRADLSSRPSVSSSWRARTPMRRRGGNS